MHGTNLSGAILKGANMSGAQLGSLSQLFTLETSFEHDLNAGPSVDAALRGQFSATRHHALGERDPHHPGPQPRLAVE